jgi:putative addiction module component (TIGR02574 family)
MNQSNDLLGLALMLPFQERASLARQLILSLDADVVDTDAEALWQSEINARLERVAQGNYSATDWNEALARIRKALAQGPAS